MKIVNKVKYIGAMLVMTFMLGNTAHAVQPTSTSGLIGTWYNVNPNTRGTVKVVIFRTGAGTMIIRTYGSCSPTPCNHGNRVAKVYSRSINSNYARGLTTHYNFGFKFKVVDARRDYGTDNGTFLRLNSFNKFAAGDARKDYFASELFRK
ncbi:MAG: hypothetical protein ACC653_06315 [Gammaproteobacteria bacterium]